MYKKPDIQPIPNFDDTRKLWYKEVLQTRIQSDLDFFYVVLVKRIKIVTELIVTTILND